MFKHILIATDGSELAGKALANGLGLAKSIGAKVTIVTVSPLWSATEMAGRAGRGSPHPIEAYEKKVADWAAKVLGEARQVAQRSAVDCATVHVQDSSPDEGIIDTARKSGCDLIVMSSHGRTGVTRVLLGSVAMKVLTHTPLPVLVCR